MWKLLTASSAIFVVLCASVRAENVVVVELFTSQGCVSCPPADEYLAGLTADPRVIPLALHVDYWDYIGWTDSFAKSHFTERQKSYARAIGSRTIYTPQFIVDGESRIEGFDALATAQALTKRLEMVSPVDLMVAREGEELVIRAVAEPVLDQPVRVQLVRYMPQATVQIERGENAGKTVSYYNIVTSWDVLGDWAGQEPLEVRVAAPGDQPAVVIVQKQGPAGVLAAAKID